MIPPMKGPGPLVWTVVSPEDLGLGIVLLMSSLTGFMVADYSRQLQMAGSEEIRCRSQAGIGLECHLGGAA